MPSRTLVAALVAEAIGTFLFFVIGAGALIMNAQTGGEVGLIGVALAQASPSPPSVPRSPRSVAGSSTP